MPKITHKTRRESLNEIIDSLPRRQSDVYNNVKKFDKGVTAKGLAVYMNSLGLVYSNDRNAVHPRLNELVKKDLIEVIGRDTCEYSNRKVAVYALKGGD